ncbi:hypothetical protein BGZ89_008087 [Linnemannia elongata]|nr:hypothetical protein BGZ89_008087 [Linnemannia elongata]
MTRVILLVKIIAVVVAMVASTSVQSGVQGVPAPTPAIPATGADAAAVMADTASLPSLFPPTIKNTIIITITMLYRASIAFVVATLLLAQLGSATSGDLVISGRHYRKPHGCYAVSSDPALILNNTPVEATGYSEANCQGDTTLIPGGHNGRIPGLKSIHID